jgi:pimeloyl-ACP methyl ester carboxylesterase
MPWVLVLPASQMACRQSALAEILGRWEGQANAGGVGMDVVVDFSMAGNELSARITVPRERVLAKRLLNLEVNPPEVLFHLPVGELQVPFKGTVRRDSLTGAVSVDGRSLGLSLRRTGAVPQPPYREEEVQFSNGNVRLSGSLLVPPTAGPHPAIVLIHGSSTPSRDDFRFYGDLFARQGIAALMYDKRNTGGQLGGMSRVDLRDLAADVVAAVSLLKRRDNIDANRIGLWGHSQGGWVAPIAATRSGSVAFVVGFSAPGVTYADLDKYANATRLRANGVAQADIDQALAALSQVDAFVRQGGDASALQERLDRLHRTRWASLTTLPRLAPTREHIETWLRWRNLDLDPVEYWRGIRVPVLLLYGEQDEVVPVRVSARRIEAALREAGNPDVTVRIFPRENHTISGSQEFLDSMVEWIVSQATPEARRKQP